jgi:hypothetical protein
VSQSGSGRFGGEKLSFPSKNRTPGGHARSPDPRTQRNVYKKHDRQTDTIRAQRIAQGNWVLHTAYLSPSDCVVRCCAVKQFTN